MTFKLCCAIATLLLAGTAGAMAQTQTVPTPPSECAASDPTCVNQPGDPTDPSAEPSGEDGMQERNNSSTDGSTDSNQSTDGTNDDNSNGNRGDSSSDGGGGSSN